PVIRTSARICPSIASSTAPCTIGKERLHMSPKTLRHLRWYICGLLFLVTTINYLDRQAVSVLNPILKKEVGWDEAGYGWIMFSFQLAYAIMLGVSGRLLDIFGVRSGFAWAVALWSLAAMAHALARTPFGFAAA